MRYENGRTICGNKVIVEWAKGTPRRVFTCCYLTGNAISSEKNQSVVLSSFAMNVEGFKGPEAVTVLRENFFCILSITIFVKLGTVLLKPWLVSVVFSRFVLVINDI